MRSDDDVDALDRAVVHALQLDGRASFRQLGAVLGVSDQTVARRYRRLRTKFGLRVRGAADLAGHDDRRCLLRIRASPHAARDVADGLAGRPDTSWISLCSGGAEIVAMVRGTGVESLLLDTLPRSRQVIDVRADDVMHVFYGGPASPYTKHGPLTEVQRRELEPSVPDRPPGEVDVTDADRRLVVALGHDGRASLEQLAARAALSVGTVQRRLARLRAARVVHFDVDVDLAVFGLPVRTLAWLRVAPASLEAVGTTMAAHPEVAFAAAVSGSGNLFASLSTSDPAAQYAYLTRRLGPLPGVTDIETSRAVRNVKGTANHYRSGAG